MTTTRLKPGTLRQRGFSMLEVLVSLTILSLVIAVVVDGINAMVSRNTVETSKVDLTQESRQFMDQITNDLHQSGFPTVYMFDPTALVPPAVPGNVNCTLYANIACGLITVSQNAIQFEGDVDGTGVSEEWIQLVQTNGPGAVPCAAPPCVIQRGTVSKATWIATGTLPPFFTEVNNVMNTNPFTFYDNNGLTVGPLPLNNAYSLGLNIRSVGITLYVRSSQRDAQTKQFPVVTMVSTAEIKD